MTVWRTGENSWCWDMSGAIGGLIFEVEHKKQVFYISGFWRESSGGCGGKFQTSQEALQGFLIRLDSIS